MFDLSHSGNRTETPPRLRSSVLGRLSPGARPLVAASTRPAWAAASPGRQASTQPVAAAQVSAVEPRRAARFPQHLRWH